MLSACYLPQQEHRRSRRSHTRRKTRSQPAQRSTGSLKYTLTMVSVNKCPTVLSRRWASYCKLLAPNCFIMKSITLWNIRCRNKCLCKSFRVQKFNSLDSFQLFSLALRKFFMLSFNQVRYRAVETCVIDPERVRLSTLSKQTFGNLFGLVIRIQPSG